MTTIAEYYGRVNAAWAAVGPLPPPTPEEAVRGARKLYRYGMRRTWTGPVEVTSGNRDTWVHSGRLLVNPNYCGQGWKEIIHSLSHYCHNRVGTDKPHSREHARAELRMVKTAIRRGWVTGKLRPAPKAARPKPDAQVVRYERTLAGIKRWEGKAKRAATALGKLRRQARRYDRVLRAAGKLP